MATGIIGAIAKQVLAAGVSSLRVLDGGTVSGFVVPPQTNGGRLTLETGVPVPTSDQSAKTTLYYETYKGSHVALYDGSKWVLHDIGSGVSIGSTDDDLDSTAIAVDSVYDIFLYLSGGALTLGAKKWTDDTNRATELARQDGVLVLTGDTGKRYLGTIRTIDSTGSKFEDSARQRLVWNYDNRARRNLVRLETTSSWNYTSATWRQANGSASNQVEVVVGIQEDAVDLTVVASSLNASPVRRATAVGVDSTTAPHADSQVTSHEQTRIDHNVASLHHAPAEGYHYFAWLEYAQAVGTATWYGDSTQPTKCGMTGSCWA